MLLNMIQSMRVISSAMSADWISMKMRYRNLLSGSVPVGTIDARLALVVLERVELKFGRLRLRVGRVEASRRPLLGRWLLGILDV